MTVRLAYACDGPGCAQERGESNHWWLLVLSGDVESLANDTPVGGLAIVDWNDELAMRGGPHVKLACGRECVQKLVERYLNSGSLEDPKMKGQQS